MGGGMTADGEPGPARNYHFRRSWIREKLKTHASYLRVLHVDRADVVEEVARQHRDVGRGFEEIGGEQAARHHIGGHVAGVLVSRDGKRRELDRLLTFESGRNRTGGV